ncbi:MAG TPA: TonB-dependent receptor [Candidatus Solibacter sp.]|nr:TonB-dependent receptor [Candidatus Solibacter sp.]
MATGLPLLFGQNDAGRIVGMVTDGTGAAVPNVAISVVNQHTKAERRVVSDAAGLYIVPNLPAFSTYDVKAEAKGFGVWETKGVPLSVGQERTLNVTLQPASVTTEVTVSGGELSVLDTSSAAVSANVNEREVATLPLNGRQLSQLYLLAPGAQTAGGGSFDNIRFSGRANQENAVRFDGVEASSIIDASPGNLNGEISTGFRLQNSLETVSEFRVDSSNYPAEFGTGTAGQISVVSKSGGNDFHGGIFEYLRNSSMDSRNFFDGATKTPLRLNQFGGSVGGPIQKDKLFFFIAQESLKQRAGVNLIGTVPSTSARARAVASIQPLLAGYPTGTPTSNPDLDLAQRTGSLSIDEYFGSFRLDHRINDKFTQYIRYNRDQGYITQPLDVTGSGQIVTGVPQNVVYTLSQIWKPTMINETKLGFNGNKTRISGFTPLIPGVDTSAFAVSFTGTVAIPGIGGQGASAGAAALGNLVRSNSSQNGRGQPYTNYTMSFIDNLAVIQGPHALKFGGEFRPIRLYTDRQGGTTYTYPSIGALLTNTPSQIQVLGDTSAADPWNNGATGNRFLKQYYLIFYGQDEWKVKPNLTINFGLRYEYYSVLHDDRNLFVLFNADTGKLACGSPAPGCDLPNTTPWYHSKKTNFGPRLGISWSPAAMHGKTVVRVGSGYYYGPGQTEDQVQPIDSDRATRTLTSGIAFPVSPASILAAYDINSPTLGYQPRAYGDGYTLPEKVLSYTASIQQQLPGGAVLTVAYVGSSGRNLFLRSWTNGIVGVTTNPTTGAGSAILKYGARFAQIDFKTSGGTDHYDSLQTTLNRRFSKGLTAGFQWTYGHSLGNTGGSNEAQTTQNPFNFEQDRGNNAFDVRHSVNLSVLYQVPFKSQSKIAQYLVGGWEVGGIYNGRTGLPVDVTITRPDLAYQINGTNQYVQAQILNGTTVTTTAVINNPYGGAFRNNRRPSVVPGVDPFLHTGDKRFFLNPAAFTIPQPGQFGNLGRFALHGPGLNQFDFTTHKKFTLTERTNLEFRAEFYNLFNRANFLNPPAVLANGLGIASNQLQPGQPYSASIAGAAFGVFNSTVSKDVGLGAQRQIQLSLRLNF